MRKKRHTRAQPREPPVPVRKPTVVYKEMGDIKGKPFGSLLKEFVPTMPEIREAFVACDQGKPLSTRQSWLIGTFVDLPYMPMRYRRILRDDDFKNHNVSYEEHRLILGCGDFENCNFCHHRYNRTNWQPVPEEHLPQNLTEYYDMIHDELEHVVNDLPRMLENPTEADFDVSDEKEPERREMTDYDARANILLRLHDPLSVSDYKLRQSLAHIIKDPKVMDCSKAKLLSHLTRIRKRLSRSRRHRALTPGEVVSAKVTSVRPYGAILQILCIKRVALLHLRNIGDGFAVYNGTRILLYKGSKVVEEIRDGMYFNVTVIEVNPIKKYAFEVSRMGVEENIEKWVKRDEDERVLALEARQEYREWRRAEALEEKKEQEKEKERKERFKPGKWKLRHKYRGKNDENEIVMLNQPPMSGLVTGEVD